MAERTAAPPGEEPDFLHFNDLVSESVGGKVIFATDEWFAPAANLLRNSAPRFVADAFTDFGKWMDGWETRRKRMAGHDWCLVRLGVAGRVCGVDVNTSFFTGNHAPFVSIQAACLDEDPALSLDGDRTGLAASQEQLDAVAMLNSGAWPEVVGVASLNPGYKDCCHNYFKVNFNQRVTHLRVNLYPDGGVSRLRVYGFGLRDWESISLEQEVDLVALTNGGVCLGFSDAHFGHPRNLIGLDRAANMADGWETARRLDRPQILKVDQDGVLQVPGCEWAVFRLGSPGMVSSIEVDTNHFKGNCPYSCRVEALTTENQDLDQAQAQSQWTSAPWELLLPPQKLRPHHRHRFLETELTLRRPVTHVRLVIVPDGGVSRLRVYGRPIRGHDAVMSL